MAITQEDYKKLVALAVKNPDGCVFQRIEKLEDGRDLCLVIGWELGFDKGEDYQKQIGDNVYTLGQKIAVNIDDLQCDYGVDWYEPWDRLSGEVYGTDQAVTKNDTVDWINEQAVEIKKLLDNGELEVE